MPAVVRLGTALPNVEVALTVDVWLQSRAVAAASLTALRLP